ncbi:MAG TPA: hypothetical protein VFK85_16520 [Anaeromyxobacteraceae bacterium]|nr:hypothetical protein [Anaeromyxobacteraceae bacterium]
MAHLLDTTPNAEELATELRTLHERREREPLSADDEARYAELWAWWQSGAGGASPPAGGGEQTEVAEAELAGLPELEPVGLAELEPAADVPAEWLAAFAEEGQEPTDAAHAIAGPAAMEGRDAAEGPTVAEKSADVDLVREWEAWQEKHRARGDPFDAVPDESGGTSYDDVMSARAEALGTEAEALAGPEEPALHDESASPGALGVEEVGSAFADVAASDREGCEPPPPDHPAPQAAPEPPRDAPPSLQGARRVVIHLSDGQVRRGQVLDVELSRDAFSYIGAGGSIESVPRADVRTVFFMRAPGVPSCGAEGVPVRVTLRDGRELTGKSADHDCGGESFTVVPDDGRSNAALVWVARSAVRSVTSGG